MQKKAESYSTPGTENLQGVSVIMDKAYEGDITRQLVFDLGMIPVVPPKGNRLSIWHYDREKYKKAQRD